MMLLVFVFVWASVAPMVAIISGLLLHLYANYIGHFYLTIADQDDFVTYGGYVGGALVALKITKFLHRVWTSEEASRQ